jgi:hypothetical protein
MDDATHTDGNHVAGLLAQVLAIDATTVVRRCPSCGADRAMAEHRAYHGAGIVLRCPACDDVALRIAVRDDGLTAELRGAFMVAVPAVE